MPQSVPLVKQPPHLRVLPKVPPLFNVVFSCPPFVHLQHKWLGLEVKERSIDLNMDRGPKNVVWTYYYVD